MARASAGEIRFGSCRCEATDKSSVMLQAMFFSFLIVHTDECIPALAGKLAGRIYRCYCHFCQFRVAIPGDLIAACDAHQAFWADRNLKQLRISMATLNVNFNSIEEAA